MAGLVLRTPYWIFTGSLAVIFLFPLVWTAVSSVSPQAGTNQTDGWGVGNYRTLADYQAGIWQYLANSAFVSLTTVVLTLAISCSAGTRSPASASPAGTSCSSPPWRSSWSRTRPC